MPHPQTPRLRADQETCQISQRAFFFAFSQIFIGTESDFFAGLRGCKCLEGHYRTHMFDKCEKCEQGLQCQDDYASLKSGYWWRWRNKTRKDLYMVFIANLLTSSPQLGENDVQYPYPLPTPYRCPEERSCKGGMDSSCNNGYNGPLCSVCTKGHYKQLHQCKQCPSKAWIAGQLSIVGVIFLIIITLCIWPPKGKDNQDEGEHSVIDSFLSKIKIAIGFYQVTYGLLEAFSYVEWPDSMQVISKYSEILQLNIFQIAPVHCLFTGLNVDAFANLFAIMTINAVVIASACVAYGVRKVIISRNGKMGEEEKSQKIAEFKEAVYKNVFFFLYVTYLSTCTKTAAVLPLACRTLCRDQREDKDELCLEYLQVDYSIQCHDHWYNKVVIVAYISTAYIISLPAVMFIALWKRRRLILGVETYEDPKSITGITVGLKFLYENYKARSWYWELVEMSRKVIITAGLILVGQETRSYIGLAWIVAGMYGALFAWIHPIHDVFENRLMTTSIAVTVFNLGVGAVSKIPAENLRAPTDSYMDTFVFNLLIVGANTLVIGLVACEKMLLIIIVIKTDVPVSSWRY